ncbi:hypothetical protein [Bacillus sp. ISL-7]|nr:hypothetical protein [Bacillus sp. ISL-7]
MRLLGKQQSRVAVVDIDSANTVLLASDEASFITGTTRLLTVAA